MQEHCVHKKTNTHTSMDLSVCDKRVSVYLTPCPPTGAASHAGSDRPLDSGSVEPAPVFAVLQFELCELPLAALDHPEQQYNPVSQLFEASCWHAYQYPVYATMAKETCTGVVILLTVSCKAGLQRITRARLQ